MLILWPHLLGSAPQPETPPAAPQPPSEQDGRPAIATAAFDSLSAGDSDPFARPAYDFQRAMTESVKIPLEATLATPPQDVLDARVLAERAAAERAAAEAAAVPIAERSIVPASDKIDGGNFESVGADRIPSVAGPASVGNPANDQRKALIPAYKPLWYQLPDGSKECCQIPVAPWAAICRLEMKFGNATYHGTGWFIGPRTIMTAAHNLFVRRDSHCYFRKADSVEIHAGATGPGNNPLPVVTSTLFDYDKRYADQALSDTQASRYDYGVIFLPTKNLGAFVGDFFKFAAVDPAADIGKIQIAGYPYDKGYQLLYADGLQTGKDPQTIIHDVDTERGQSGAPIYHYHPTTGYTVFGIHTDGFGTDGSGLAAELGFGAKRNAGVRISPALKKRMDFWIANPGAKYDSNSALS